MESRHVRIDYETALESKKQILGGEANLLTIFKKIKTYRLIRKQKQTLKTELKNQAISLKENIQQLTNSFPHQKNEKKIISHSLNQIKISKNVQKELDDIKRKLEQLG